MAVLGSMPTQTQLDLALGALADDQPVDPIVHELMHHSAANSPVNVALQYRWLEFLRIVLSTPGHHLDDQTSAMARQLAATEALLQPVAEGLALFAEFDCCVTDLSDPSQRYRTAIDFISLRLLSLRSTPGDLHQAAIAEKTSTGQTRRRADVLAHPLYPRMTNDTYLLGYLVVKEAWTSYLESASTSAGPAGNFAEFVHYWFYEDWRLAELLLHPTITGDFAVVRRLGQRIRRLFDDDLPARVDAFVRDKTQRQERGMLLRGPEEREHGPLSGLELSLLEVVDAQYAFELFHRARVGPSAPLQQGPLPNPQSLSEQVHNALVTPLGDDQEQAIRAYFERNPGQPHQPLRLLDSWLEMPQLNRTRAALLDLWIEVEIVGDHLAALRVDDTTPWRKPPGVLRVTVDRPGLHRARLLGMLSSKVKASPWRLDCFVIIDGFVRAYWCFGEPDADEWRGDVNRINYYEAIRAASGIRPEDYLTAVSVAYLEDDDARVVADPTVEATVAVSMAMREALSQRGWEALFALSPAIADTGIRTLLGGPAVRALAATGLVNSFTTARAEVTERLSALGHDLDALIAACDRIVAEHGVQLLVADADPRESLTRTTMAATGGRHDEQSRTDHSAALAQ